MAIIRNRGPHFSDRRVPIFLLVALLLSVGIYEIFFRGNGNHSVFPGARRTEDQRVSKGDSDAGVAGEFSGQSFKELPWHVVVVQRQFAPRSDVKSIAVDIEFADEVTSTGNLFIVPISLHGRDTYCYFGAITNCEGMRNGDELRHVDLGHGFVFSRWGEKDPASCRPADGGYYLASGHEGDHISVRLLHPWGKGRYTFTLKALADGGNKSRELWVGAYVYSYRANTEYFVGALRFSDSGLSFSGNLGSFLELYRAQSAFPKSIPSAEASIGSVRINNQRQIPISVIAEYPDGVPKCARAAGRSEASGKLQELFPEDPAAVMLMVGKNVSRETPASEHLKPLSPKAPPASPTHEASQPPPTDEECRKLATDIETAVQTKNVSDHAQLLGMADMVKNGIDELGATQAEQSRLLFIDPFGIGTAFAQRIVDEVSRGGTYRLVHLHRVEGQLRALFRVRISATDDLDYHDLSFVRKPDGNVGIGEVTFLAAGDTLSALTRRMALTLVPPDQRRLSNSDGPADGLLVREGKTYHSLAKSFSEGKYKDALKSYGDLSPQLQQEKHFCAMRVRAARHVGGEEYTRAIENMRKLYPNDVSTDFLSIFYFIPTGRHKDALAAIDRTDAAFGGDPGMDVLRGLVHLSAASFEKARECLKHAIDRERTLVEAYWAITTVTLKERKFDDTVEWLKRIQGELHVVVGDLTNQPEYADFIKTPQYQDWLQWQKTHPQRQSPPKIK